MQCDVFNPQASEGVQPMHRRTSTTTVTLPNFIVLLWRKVVVLMVIFMFVIV